ncbi:hypothetical protein HMPREF2540_13600 [Enterobacter sp. HMSC055A11]|nr:hypothetical protein HMPREF2540_13600 [Enterobacter sp. HMSC055A11]
MPDNVIYFQLITPVIYVFPAVLPTVATVIFFTSFSGACRLIIEMILVIYLVKQMNVLNNKRMLNFRTKFHRFTEIWHSMRVFYFNAMINNNFLNIALPDADSATAMIWRQKRIR